MYADEKPREMKELCWDEFVVNGTPMLTISATDLLPPSTPEYAAQQDLAISVNIRPPMLIFSVQIQETGQWSEPDFWVL